MNIATAINIQKGVKLADQCRFGVGGVADFFIEVKNKEELVEAIKYVKENKLNYFVYAGGSNLFFADKGFRGVIIRMIDGGFEIDKENHRVTVSGGYNLSCLVRELAAENWGGLEFLGNVPGSVGGAVVGNAGCYGEEVKDVLVEAEIYDVDEDKFLDVSSDFLEFEYRHSKLKYDSRYIVTSATFKLREAPAEDIFSEIETELEARLDKHPHDAKCGGSFFKNPEGMLAWKVIADAGMANARVGDAIISPKHSNFLINKGNATSADIIKLAKTIQNKVKDELNTDLQPEVRYVGEFGIEEI